jgi:adenylate cyclase
MNFKNIYLKAFPYLGNLGIILLMTVILSLPFFNQLNLLILDRIKDGLESRSEIVLVGIDDRSLQELGAWPWNRDIFAKAIDKLNTAKASVIGVDIVFFESRSGDETFQNSLNSSKVPVVLGNKIFEGQENKTIFEAPKVTQAYTNITPDPDGKVRQTKFYEKIQTNCVPSLAFEITKQHFRDKKDLTCQETQKLGPNLSLNKVVDFNYSSNGFKSVSFYDLYSDQVDLNYLNGKIVLIGVTASDIKSSVSDNFVGIDGQTISGIELNANIINSILQNRFQIELPKYSFTVVILVISSLLIWIYRKIKQDIFQFILFLGAVILIEIGGLYLYDYGYNWPLVETVILLGSCYVYYVVLKYLTEQRQNSFLKQAFSRYINPKLLTQLLSKPEGLTLGGEKKNMTVLFSDIRGFTSISEKLDPTALIEIINKYLERMCAVILKNNGTIDKFIGDAIMAFWNAPLEEPEHQLLAIKTALEMQVEIESFNQEISQNFKVGVGINTGDMVVGNVGSNLRFDYTVLGDNVNLGSRIEGLTKKYGVAILITESVVENLIDVTSHGIIFRLLDRVIVKGKSKPIDIYEPMLDTTQNKETATKYSTAFKHYQAGEFEHAIKIWDSLTTDACSQIMSERSKTIALDLDGKWNGVWKWDEK